ncbi:hypothetical protein IU498_32735 [Nocardia beijingensis]|uniref:hypothetical protein n=1 Tax=Nocardia beijingensis TaxID=95162 RepID=UPI001893EC41|nr:hypothetical protein [Nocardia beijingensis]MBF6079398.1 hypothetical protein [Nocardia beijingensis]
MTGEKAHSTDDIRAPTGARRSLALAGTGAAGMAAAAHVREVVAELPVTPVPESGTGLARHELIPACLLREDPNHAEVSPDFARDWVRALSRGVAGAENSSSPVA